MNELKFAAYWADIPTDKKQKVFYDELKMWWNVNDREVRRIMQELGKYDNGDNYVLIRSGKSKGFYKTDNIEEILPYKREILNKGRSLFAPIKKINRILNANKSQISFENNMRVMRESLNIKQAQVCEFMQQYDEAFDVPMLSKMENGICLPTPFQLSKLAEFYACDPKDIVNVDMYF